MYVPPPKSSRDWLDDSKPVCKNAAVYVTSCDCPAAVAHSRALQAIFSERAMDTVLLNALSFATLPAKNSPSPCAASSKGPWLFPIRSAHA